MSSVEEMFIICYRFDKTCRILKAIFGIHGYRFLEKERYPSLEEVARTAFEKATGLLSSSNMSMVKAFLDTCDCLADFESQELRRALKYFALKLSVLKADKEQFSVPRLSVPTTLRLLVLVDVNGQAWNELHYICKLGAFSSFAEVARSMDKESLVSQMSQQAKITGFTPLHLLCSSSSAAAFRILQMYRTMAYAVKIC